MGHSYMGATSDFVVGGLRDCNTSPAPSWRLRPRVSRGAAISCIPIPRGPSASPPSSQPPPPSLFLATSVPLPPPSPVHLSRSFTSSSSSSPQFSKEERRKFEMTARRCWNGGGEITAESGIERKRGVRGGKNCIHSNHICERHRALRNQLNEEKLAEGDSSSRRMERVKEREKENGYFEKRGLGGIPRAHCSVKWMKRGKTKRQTAKDGTCSNQGISNYTYIYFSCNSFHLFSSSILSPEILFLSPPSTSFFFF